ncbi:hypothetical protein SRB5_68890 [Streptomyces sp. RB5]|uniref:Glyoxalase-like domain-containing protein n=1 Tax=Streptomyces smaragdinus TaxID=2585196 RepID=A0A7K0CT71_9ACTN|nr:VOC family protein [Streptomyces smaragdinus]MQY16687.1 hypothetical protein [Streptomyces smaragdinus]
MASQLYAIRFGATRPAELARFWGGVLGREVDPGARGGGVELPAGDVGQLRIRFVESQAPKVGQNRMHFDLTSATDEEQQAIVERVLVFGGRHLDIGQGSDAPNVVLADPDGNELDIIEAGNNFLAGTGQIGALACDGSQAVGYFWSEALGWPLVWDQDEETAIQAPEGGTKITWGGPPVEPQQGKNRLTFDLVVPAGEDRDAEIARLVSLGAKHVGTGDDGHVEMTDPDGTEFSVLPVR